VFSESMLKIFHCGLCQNKLPSMLNVKPRTIINIQHLEITCFYGFLVWVMSDTYVYNRTPKALSIKAFTTAASTSFFESAACHA